jgi:hypothetical protein
MDFDDRKSCSRAVRRRLPKDLRAASGVRTNIRRLPAPKFQRSTSSAYSLVGRKASCELSVGCHPVLTEKTEVAEVSDSKGEPDERVSACSLAFSGFDLPYALIIVLRAPHCFVKLNA